MYKRIEPNYKLLLTHQINPNNKFHIHALLVKSNTVNYKYEILNDFIKKKKPIIKYRKMLFALFGL